MPWYGYPSADKDEIEEVMRQNKNNPQHWYAKDIKRLAERAGNHLLSPEEIKDVTDSRYWHNYIQQLNRQYRIGGVVPPHDSSEFTFDCRKAFACKEVSSKEFAEQSEGEDRGSLR